VTQVKVRYVPNNLVQNFTGSFNTTGYQIKGILPDVLLQRRANKGLENLAVSPDGKIAFTMLQSGMGPSSSGSTQYSYTLTAVKLDISDPLDAKVLGTYLHVADSADQWGQNPKVNKIYSSSLAWASQHIKGRNLSSSYPLILVGERANDQVRPCVRRSGGCMMMPEQSRHAIPAPSILQVKVYLADFSNATDVSGMYGGDPLKFDKIGEFLGLAEQARPYHFHFMRAHH
jgi:hypothetical protein